jgi:hypothetical protein
MFKRKELEEAVQSSPKKIMFDDDCGNVLKHYIIDAKECLSENQMCSLFKRICIAGLHEKSDNDHVVKHYHILGEAKYTKRQIRDMSLQRLRASDILGGLEARDWFMSSKIKNIQSKAHFDNTYKYIKNGSSKIIKEDASIPFGPSLHPVFKILDEAEEPKRFSNEEMEEFRKRFPLINSWKKVCAQKRHTPKTVQVLQDMEDQRKWEDKIRPMNDEEYHKLLPNYPLLAHAKKLKQQMVNHDRNSGVCLILCGKAMTMKSTLNRVIASSFGEYNIWPGSQWIQRDPLKFDTAARQGVSTIVVEEMQWIDVQHRVTLEKTITTIKEQLTGAGLDVRLAKTKSALQDDIKFKMDYLLISMNESDYVTFNVLQNLINSKAEYKRRFILINMDDPNYGDLAQLRERPDNNWVGNETVSTNLLRFIV